MAFFINEPRASAVGACLSVSTQIFFKVDSTSKPRVE